MTQSLCKCGCGLPAGKDKMNRPVKYKQGHYTKRGTSNPNYKAGQAIYRDSPDQEPPICKCGCGLPTYWIVSGRKWAKYNKGHYTKKGTQGTKYRGGRKRLEVPEGESPPPCKCGCHQLVTWDGGHGRWHKYVIGHYVPASGERHPKWKGGIVKPKYESYNYDWIQTSKKYRASVGWNCEDCDKNFSDNIDLLHTHHLDKNSKNDDWSNFRAVCFECHGKYHGKIRIGGLQPIRPDSQLQPALFTL